MSQTVKQLAAMFLAAILTFALCIAIVLYQFRPRPESRREMRDFMSKVKVGDDSARVRQFFYEGDYQNLTKSEKTEGQPDLWHFSTPFEFGSGNWILWMEFENQKVRALRLRIADGIKHRPRDAAPPDIVAADYASDFPDERREYSLAAPSR